MSKFLTAQTIIVIFLSHFAMATGSEQVAPLETEGDKCLKAMNELTGTKLTRPDEPKTREEWVRFLGQIPMKESDYSTPLDNLPAEQSSEINDGRLYRLNEFVDPNPKLDDGDRNLRSTFAHYQDEYEFIGRPGINDIYLFRSKKSLKEFSTCGFPAQYSKKYPNDTAYKKALVDFLREQEAKASEKTTDPALDYYFERMKKINYHFRRLQKFWNEEDAQYVQWQNAQFLRKPSERYFLSTSRGSKDERWLTREVIEKENFFVEIIETRVQTSIRSDKPINDDGSKARAKQRQWLDEIMAKVLPEYAERRKWSMDFITGLYKEAVATADLTRYIMVREKGPDGKSGKILAVLGLNRAPYGTVRYFNKATNQWEVRTGPFGSSYVEAFGQLNRPADRYFSTWSDKVPLLGMEEYLGIRLSRPSLIEDVMGPSQEMVEYNFSPRPSNPQIPGVTLDSDQPIYFGSGEIYEPVRFYVDPEVDNRGGAYEELIGSVLENLMPDYRGMRYSLSAQYLYTYNPRDGVILYRGQGFLPNRQFQPQTKDGQTWHVLGASLPNFAKKFHSSSSTSLDSSSAQDVVNRIRDSVDQFLELELRHGN